MKAAQNSTFIRVLFSVLLLLAAAFSRAGDLQPIIEQANKAYSGEQYSNAIEIYKQVLDQGYESPDLYYNLGNAYYKMNQFPSAILYYEKAKKLDPGNDDIEFNLRIVNNKIPDKIEPIPQLFYIRWYKQLIGVFSFDTWAKLTVILFVLSLFLAGIYYISRILFLRKAGFWAAIVSIFVSLLFFLFTMDSYYRFKTQKEAIVFTPTVTIKSSPDEKSIDLFVIHEGTKVRIMDRIGDWYEIQIANGSVGWLPASSVEKI